MTATIRKQIQRSRLAHSGGKRLDLYLTRHESDALDEYAKARNFTNLSDALRCMIGETYRRMSEPGF